MSFTYDELVKDQAGMTRDQIAARAQSLTAPAPTAPAPAAAPAPAPGSAQLPSLTGGATPGAATMTQDPITLFNLKLMELLGKAQGANTGNTALTVQREKLQNENIDNSMKPADEIGIDNLAPSDALNARQNEAALYNPEIKSLNDRMQLNNEAVTRFGNTLEAAQKLGEQYAKMIKPSEATVEAIRLQLRSGVLPSQDILDKVQSQLTEEDWHAYVAAKNGATDKTFAELNKITVPFFKYEGSSQVYDAKTQKPVSYEEYKTAGGIGSPGNPFPDVQTITPGGGGAAGLEDAPSSYKEYALTDSTPTPAEYDAWLTKDANRKAVRGSTTIIAGDPYAAKDQTRVTQIINAHPPSGRVGGTNNVLNGAQWDAAAAQIEAEGLGPASKYNDLLVATYAPNTRH